MRSKACWQCVRRILCAGFIIAVGCGFIGEWSSIRQQPLTGIITGHEVVQAEGPGEREDIVVRPSSKVGGLEFEASPGQEDDGQAEEDILWPGDLKGQISSATASASVPVGEEVQEDLDLQSHDQEQSSRQELVAGVKETLRSTAPSHSADKDVPKEYSAEIYVDWRECASQAKNFGTIATVEECDRLAVASPECGSQFMFSKNHPDWHCRCCTPSGADDGPVSDQWDVYTALTPRSSLKMPKKSKKKNGSRAGVEAGLYIEGAECSKQVLTFGRVASPADCDRLSALTPECGNYFMFSHPHPDWGCRCCPADGADGGPRSSSWNVYTVLTERPKEPMKIPTAPRAADPFRGLPIAAAPRPEWLLRDDELVVDARRPPGERGILIVQAVLMDARSDWGKTSGPRPHWLRAILATNRAHAQRHGHAVILRAHPTQPQLTKWQWLQCAMKDPDKCLQANERENFNWEKHLMMSDYLNSEQNFSHVLMLDADAALVHPEHDTLRQIAAVMDAKGKHVFLTDEDWLEYGAGRINGGLIFVRTSQFTRDLFLDTFDAHLKGSARLQNWRIGIKDMECSSNEQVCLNDLWQGTGQAVFKPYAMMASGKRYNLGAERGGEKKLGSPGVEVMHWMGGSKGGAGNALCRGGRNFTGEGESGYGCRRD